MFMLLMMVNPVNTMIQLLCFFMNFYLRELNFINLKVKVAKPVIYIAFIVVFHSAELVKAYIDATKNQWNLKATLVELEFRIYQWKNSPGNDIIFWYCI
jgi:hypothetical protein